MFSLRHCYQDRTAFLPNLLVLITPCALLLHKALTLAPDKHVGLEICGVCVGDSSQDIVEGGVTDLPSFLHCEQPGEKDIGPSGSPGCYLLAAGGIHSLHHFRHRGSWRMLFPPGPVFVCYWGLQSSGHPARWG